MKESYYINLFCRNFVGRWPLEVDPIISNFNYVHFTCLLDASIMPPFVHLPKKTVGVTSNNYPDNSIDVRFAIVNLFKHCYLTMSRIGMTLPSSWYTL